MLLKAEVFSEAFLGLPLLDGPDIVQVLVRLVVDAQVALGRRRVVTHVTAVGLKKNFFYMFDTL